MGWFTNNSKSWELKNSWMFLLSILLVFPYPIPFYPIALLIIGWKAKKINWILLGVLGLIIGTYAFYLHIYKYNSFAHIFLVVFAPIIGNIILMLFIDSYLKRLDLSRIVSLEWGKEYPYYKLMDKALALEKEAENIDFRAELLLWKEKIDEVSIKKNINEIIVLIKQIEDKDKSVSKIILVRHRSTINAVLKQYDDLENSKLENATVKSSKEKLINTLSISLLAFENELTNLFKTEILEVNAETDAYIQTLRNKDII